jgi:HlyD family type I secretion membrane fusion protein
MTNLHDEMNFSGLRYASSAPNLVGYTAVLILVTVFIIWGVGTNISGAVIANGEIRPMNERAVVQHQYGGTVSEVAVREGDFVEAGDLLLRLDDTLLRSELVIVEQQLAETLVRRFRFEAERDDEEQPDFSNLPKFKELSEGEVSDLIEGQSRLFRARQTSVSNELMQISRQIDQMRQKITGVDAQLSTSQTLLSLLTKDLDRVENLFRQKLVSATRVSEVTREKARIEGEIGRLIAVKAEARKRVSELEIKKENVGNQWRESIIDSLRNTQLTLMQLKERRQGILEQIKRLDIRSPRSGTVFSFNGYVPGRVLSAGAVILTIVPKEKELELKVRVRPEDIENVYKGQHARIVLSGVIRRTFPDLRGVVRRVSADTKADEKSGEKYYEVVVEIEANQMALLGGVEIIPGMPVQVFLKTNLRKPIAYLTDPITAYFDKSFREQH